MSTQLHTLLKFQIGPVQDFIAQARSTRDLWSGSYLLSFLVAAGIRAIPNKDEALIFPNPEGQLLLDHPRSWGGLEDQKALLTPNLPNLFVARVPGNESKAIAQGVCDAITKQWDDIAKSVWSKQRELGLSDKSKTTFDAQVDRHLSISWQMTPETGNSPESYVEDYGNNDWHLDAVRQTREFDALGSGIVQVGGEKDSLNGRDEAIAGGKEGAKEVAARFKHLFKHEDYIGAVSLIKRVWHLTYLKDVLGLRTRSDEFNIRSTRAIATRSATLDDEEERTESLPSDKYLAAIAFDGDSIGAWVSGDKLTNKSKLEGHQKAFSKCLSKFALQRAQDTVEGTNPTPKDGEFKGYLIYAGGDDVVALMPAEDAVEIGRQLNEAFCEETKNGEPDKDGNHPDASAGIAIAHFKSPLQDLIREAQLAEKRAKNTVGRPAFSVSLMKRSGEISHWGAKWDSGGIELYQAIELALKGNNLSAKFPHRVCQLLEPYLTKRTGLGQQSDALDFSAQQVIRSELLFAAERQGSKATAETFDDPLNLYLKRIAESYQKTEEQRAKEGKPPSTTTLNQTQVTAIIGLCTTLAFADRNRTQAPSPKGI